MSRFLESSDGRSPAIAASAIGCAFFTSVLAVISLPANPAAAQPPAVSGYEVAWFDEFNGNSIDLSNWDIGDTNVPTNSSLQDYHPDQVSVSGGNLIITTDDTYSRGLDFKSGLVISDVRQQYGRWEVRAKLPTSTGIWPAIWLLSDTDVNLWPSQGEIDIMENRGNQPDQTSSAFHYGTNPPYDPKFIGHEQKSVASGNQVNYADSFHDYAVEWSGEQIRFYVDDVHHATVRDHQTGGFLSHQTDGMKLIINTAVGGTFLPDPDESTLFPQQFSVDHVYAYTISASDPVLTFENGSFDQNGGSLAHWLTFGNTIGSGTNVRGDDQFVLSGDGSLKLYGGFTGEENYSGVAQGLSVTPGEELLAEASSYIYSADSLAGTENFGELKIDYFSELYGEFGSSSYLGSDSILIGDYLTPNDFWIDHQLSSIVPAGAVEARLALVFVQPQEQGGALHIDNVSFKVVTSIPEPGALSGLAAMWVIAVAGSRRRRARRR